MSPESVQRFRDKDMRKIKKLRHVARQDGAGTEGSAMTASRCLGLIGGLGVGAAIHYYRELSAEHQKRNRTLDLLMVHAEVERVLGNIRDNDLTALADYLAELMRRLSRAGADVAAIAAVA